MTTINSYLEERIKSKIEDLNDYFKKETSDLEYVNKYDIFFQSYPMFNYSFTIRLSYESTKLEFECDNEICSLQEIIKFGLNNAIFTKLAIKVIKDFEYIKRIISEAVQYRKSLINSLKDIK